MHACVFRYIQHAHLHTYILVFDVLYVCVYMYIHTHTHAISTGPQSHAPSLRRVLYIYIYIYIYTHTHTHTQTHTHTHTQYQQGLKHTLLVFDAFFDVENKAKAGNKHAKEILQSWADAEWYLTKPDVPDKITTTVFFVKGETNTDDLSPAPDAWSRPDIPLHGLAMLKTARDGIVPDQDGLVGPIKQMEELKKKGFPLAYVGDVVGTGSSRKSATNSVLWFMGDDIPHVPNKRTGGVCLGGKIAPIFFNTMEDSGALPIELDVSIIYPFLYACV
jgi:aconitase B